MHVFSDEYFMNKALEQAKLAYDEDEVPVGAVITCENKILGKGYNQTQKLKDVTAHAEMLAITAATEYLGAKYLNECTLYVTLEPCVMCAGALAWAQIGRIVIGAPDIKRGYQCLNASILHPKTIVHQLNGCIDCGLLLKKFFENKRA
jgi:tRNA(adenine34) deaminase